MVLPDNQRASIVTRELHDPEELRTRVSVPSEFTTPLKPPSQPLYPIDLQDDYRKFMLESMQRKKSRNYDDDTASFDLAAMEISPEVEDSMSRWRNSKGQRDSANEKSFSAKRTESVASDEPIPEAKKSGGTAPALSDPPQESNGAVFKPEPAGVPGPSQHQADVADREPFQPLQVRKGMLPAGDISLEARDRILAKLNASTSAPPQQEDLVALESLSPGAADESDELHEVPDADRLGTDDEQGHAAPKGSDASLHNSDRHSQIANAATNRGDTKQSSAEDLAESYRAGYAEALDKFRALGEGLQSAAQQIDELRTQVLREGREIFVEVMKLTAENILRRQLGVSDKALFELFDAALDSLHHARRISVQANPQTLMRLKQQYAEAGLDFESIEWVASDKILLGDFKIASRDEVIRVDLEALVTKQINSLAGDIFAPNSGTSDQAGWGAAAGAPVEPSPSGGDEEQSSAVDPEPKEVG